MNLVQAILASTATAGGGSSPPPPPSTSYRNESWVWDTKLNDLYAYDGANPLNYIGTKTTNTVQFADGTVGDVIVCNGGVSPGFYTPDLNANDYFSLSDGSLTLDLWFYPTSYSQALICETSQSSHFPVNGDSYWNTSLLEIDSSGHTVGRIWGASTLTSTGTVNLNAWNHVILKYSVPNIPNIGVCKVAMSLNNETPLSTDLGSRVASYQANQHSVYYGVGGADQPTNLGNATNFVGHIGYFRVSNFNAPSSYDAFKKRFLNIDGYYIIDGLQLYVEANNYRIDGYPDVDATRRWYDLSGYANDAIIGGVALTWNSVGTQSFTFSSTNSGHADVTPKLPGFGMFGKAPNGTLSMWANFTSLGTYQHLMGFRPDSGNNFYLLIMNDGFTSEARVATLNGNTDISQSLASYVGTWARYDFVVSGTTTKLYVNGTQIGTATCSGNWNTISGSSAFGICGVNNSYINNETKVASVQVYNRALSDAEVLANYNSSITWI
jgi:hypothetical protein